MKQIIILLLIILLAIFGYAKYKTIKRFSTPNVSYKVPDSIDINYHNQDVLYDYFEAVESLNQFVLLQWTANEIDVRAPKNDDSETIAATSAYAKKMAKVKYYETKLKQSKTYKDSGLSNADIKNIEQKGINTEALKHENKVSRLKNMFFANKNSTLTIGDKGALVYELQKILVKKGYDIPIDGLYISITSGAVKAFEEKNNLYPDGNIDGLTLDALLE